MLDHFFPLFFPKDSKSLKNIGHPTLRSGGKKTVKWDLKSEKSEEKNFFCARRFQTVWKQKFSYLRPLLSITFPQEFRISKNIGHPTLGSGGKKTVKRYLKSEKSERKKKLFLRRDFRQFSNKNVHIWDHFFPLLFPKDSESLMILDIRLWEEGAKRPFNGTSKANRHTDKHTDRRTDILTYRKH